jgi:ADP-heptose:LPS heptosyltransferase/SAM-dependent methyltransferase
MDIPRFKARNLEDGRHSVVGDCNGHSCEERWELETPAFARAIAAQIPQGATTILDYGCGVGRLAKEVLKFNKKVTILGVDASDDELRLAKEYVNDSRFIPTKPEDLAQKVDLVYCIYVLQHIPAIELRHAIERMHHFLKGTGKLVYCSSDYRMAINSGGGFTDDRGLGVDIRKELGRLFIDNRDLFDLDSMDVTPANTLIRDLITAEGCPGGSIPHPAKIYTPRKIAEGQYFQVRFPGSPQNNAQTHQEAPEKANVPDGARKAPGGPKRLILRNRQSPGDILVMTAALRSLHKAYPGQFLTDVDSPVPEIFDNNPYITKLPDEAGGQVIDMHYPLISDAMIRGRHHPGAGVSGRHFSDGHRKYLEEVLELEIPRTGLLPDIFLSQDERLWKSPVLKHHDHDGPYWVINAGSKSDFTLKQYHRYQEVVDLLKGKITFVQIGHLGDDHRHDALEGALDMRGRTGHRELFRLIYHAEGVLTCVSYPMHIAGAFQKPCVVVAGGRESPRWELYPNHRFIHTTGALPCCAYDGCWKNTIADCAAPVNVALARRSMEQEEKIWVEAPKCLELIKPRAIVDAIELYYEGGILKREEANV